MKQMIWMTSEVPPEGSARVFAFFGRKVPVWRIGDRTRAAANLYLHSGRPLDCKDGAFVCHWNGPWLDMINGCRLNDLAANDGLMFLPASSGGYDLVDVWGEAS